MSFVLEKDAMQFRALRVFVLAIAVIGLIGCAASTKIVNQWTNPEYTAPRFRRILVIAVSKQPGIRRTFEDEFVAQLKSAGVDAVPSYRYIPEDGQAAEARMSEAVKLAGADAAVITRLIRVDKEIEVRPGLYMPAPAATFGFYPGYYNAWLGYYDPPTVYQRDVYVSETNLYDLTKNQLVWSGTAQTIDPPDIGKAIKGYVSTVIETLKSKNLLPSR
jgi:hypothetical protein